MFTSAIVYSHQPLLHVPISQYYHFCPPSPTALQSWVSLAVLRPCLASPALPRHSGNPSARFPPGPLPGESKTTTIDRLSAEVNVARMAKTAAERQLREVEDVLRGKEQLMDIQERQTSAAWEAVDEMKAQLAARDVAIARLKADAETFPLSSPALLRSHHLLSTTFDTLRECFTCPLCYEGLAKGEALSLQCGHTFCANCVHKWITSRRPAGFSQPPGKTVANVECPECRLGTAHPTARRVRLYMLEEAVRLLARAEKERDTVEVEERTRREALERGEGEGEPAADVEGAGMME